MYGMRQQYALLVYFLIMGKLCLGDLLMPLFPMVVPFSRSYNRPPDTLHKAFTRAKYVPAASFSCAEEHESPYNAPLAQALMAVFGNDTLWQRAQQSQAPKRMGKLSRHPDQHKISPANPFIASWATISSLLPFGTDLDLGANSDTDVYVQFLAKKQWALPLGIHLNTTQMFRYGSDSKNYAETTLDLTQTRQQQNRLSTRFNISKAPEADYSWNNRTFQQLNMPTQGNLSYGIVTTGEYDNRNLRINEWGPYFSWRRPIWRNWIFMQNDLNYLNAPASSPDNHLSYQLSFEARF